jgi:hypothetical protein
MKKVVKMRGIALFVFFLVLVSTVSAEIIIEQQPKQIYNLGEVVSVPITIKSVNDVSGVLDVNLICSGNEINFYKNGVSLSTGEEKAVDASLILTKNLLGDSKGVCVVKAILGSDYSVTNEFTISDSIELTFQMKNSEINPGEDLIISGKAVKDNGEDVNGFVELELFSQGQGSPYTTHLGTINDGVFNLVFTSQPDMPAGTYIVKINGYEKDVGGTETNKGFVEGNFVVSQLPTNIEIVIGNQDVIPGTPLKAKVILHDQSGTNIPTTLDVEIRDSNNKLVEKINVQTDEPFEYLTGQSDSPGGFKITASSQEIESETYFIVKEKQDISVEVVNKTVILTNIGNVPYCGKSVVVKIGDEPLEIDVCLGVGEEKRYLLSAPDGEYKVEVLADDEESVVRGSVVLTGSTIDLKEAGSGVLALSRRPFVWIFVVGIFGFVFFMVYKQGFRRSFVGGTIPKRKSLSKPTAVRIAEPISMSKGPLVKTRNSAQLSLSIKGETQNTDVVCLKIKNSLEVLSHKDSVSETMNRIAGIVESSRALLYESEGCLFILLVPSRTRTFRNEQNSLRIASQVRDVLNYHNKIFKQKIDFGISLNHGPMIVKDSQTGFEFASLGDLLSKSKKVASTSNGEPLISEKMKERFGANIKAEKLNSDGGTQSYSIREVRDRENTNNFIKGFLRRNEK